MSFSGSGYSKLSFSITTDKLSQSGLISNKDDSLGVQEPDIETKNFGHCLIDCAMLNWMMKCDGRRQVNNKKILMISWSFYAVCVYFSCSR